MMTAELQIETCRRSELVAVTRQVEELLRTEGWRDGVLTLFVPHTTAGITVNEQADPDVASDMARFLDQLIPDQGWFRHGEGNSDAHIKATLVGASLQVIVREGRLWLGTWQGLWFAEFDGPRRRTLRLAFQ